MITVMLDGFDMRQLIKGQTLRLFLLLAAITCIFGPFVKSAHGQDSIQQIGLLPFSKTLPAPSGYVNPVSGDLHLDIPLGSYPQRGKLGPSAFKLSYDSGIWSQITDSWCCGPWGLNASWPIPGASFSAAGGWQLSVPGDGGQLLNNEEDYYCGSGDLEESTYSDWYWIDPQGTTHTFVHVLTQVGYNPGYPCSDDSSVWTSSDSYADDGSGYHLYASGWNAVIYDKDGMLTGVEDANGNEFGSFTSGPSWTDDLGRTVLSGTMYTGNTFTFRMRNDKAGSSYNSYVATTANIIVNGSACSDYYGYNCSLPVVQSIALPDGTSYTFQYDCDPSVSGQSTVCYAPTGGTYYGGLTKMTLPTGGVVSFTYTFATVGGCGNDLLLVTSMTTPDGEWTFAQSNPSGAPHCESTTTVTKPSYNGRNDTIVYTAASNFLVSIQYYTGSSTLLATETECFSYTSWVSGCPSGSTTGPFYEKTADIVTLPMPGGSNVTKTTYYAYDSFVESGGIGNSNGNLTTTKEWNFGGSVSNPADRTTTTNYVTSSAYWAKDLRDLPSSVVVTNSSGATVAETLYTYDGSALVTSGATGVTDHDDTHFGSGDTVRGKVTQIQKLVTGSTYTTESMTYDITGQMRTHTDANGNSTTYSYADNFYTDAGDSSNPSSCSSCTSTPTNAYVKTVTQGSLVTTFGYYWGTGQKAVVSDPNSQTIYFHFYDSQNRPTSTELPNQYNGNCCAWTMTAYSSSETQVDNGTGITSLSLSAACSGSGACRHDQQDLDGLGRVTTKILANDPDCSGGSRVAITYDSNGRIASTSNRYCSTSDPSYGVTTFSYDGLDRKTVTTQPDSTAVNTYYGAAVSSYGGRSGQLCSGYGTGYPILDGDEAGKLRQTWIDGFDRLIEVDEPDPSTGSLTSGSYQKTCYLYDLNDNLTAVTSPGQSYCGSGSAYSRCFSYDMLSRLTVAQNPESGTVNYYYTTSGGSLCSGEPSDVCRRTDARSITTTYTYDSLNRLTGKSYSDSTPSVSYSYDSTSCLSLSACYNAGRRTGMSDGSGSTSWAYDQVGNVWRESRTIGSISKTISPTYNLDSTLEALQYPGGRTLTYTTGNAERPTQTADNTNSITYAQTAEYIASGALSSLTNGASAMVFSTLYYNNRLQPCRIAINSTGTAPTECTDSGNTGNVMDLTYNFNYGSSDNGNLKKATDNRSGMSGRSINYNYDMLNRIANAYTDATSGSYCWGETYTIDALGNLTGIGDVTSPDHTGTGCSEENLSISVTSNNQISGFCYDASGNLLAESPAPCPSPTYIYNGENELTSTAGVTYTYDGDGNRVEKSSGSLYWYDPTGKVIEETDGSGNTVNQYVFFNGSRIARQDSSNNVFYYFPDQLGTSRDTVQAGYTSYCYDADFYPYGGERYYTDTCDSHFKFTGKERDSESGLDNFGARYNSSQIGRFMSPDPVAGDRANPQSLNAYSYVWNNPIKLTDPTGMVVDWEDSDKKCKKGEQICLTDAQRAFLRRLQELLSSKNAKDRANGAALQGTYNRLDQRTDVTFEVVNQGGSGENGGEITYQGDNHFTINLSGSDPYGLTSNQRLAHEFEHGRQIFDGELSFKYDDSTGKWGPFAHDLTDEANGFAAGFSMERASPGQSQIINGAQMALDVGGSSAEARYLHDHIGDYHNLPMQVNVPNPPPPGVYAVPK